MELFDTVEKICEFSIQLDSSLVRNHDHGSFTIRKLIWKLLVLFVTL